MSDTPPTHEPLAALSEEDEQRVRDRVHVQWSGVALVHQLDAAVMYWRDDLRKSLAQVWDVEAINKEQGRLDALLVTLIKRVEKLDQVARKAASYVEAARGRVVRLQEEEARSVKRLEALLSKLAAAEVRLAKLNAQIPYGEKKK